jgi:hypothetical protein
MAQLHGAAAWPWALAVKGKGRIVSGMSGSPILSVDGKAMGLISTDELNPVLTDCLPARFFH